MSAILKPIVLWTPTATLTSDEACTSIYQYQLAPPPSSIRAPYQSQPTPTKSLSYLPPLQFFCIKALLEWPDQVHALGPAQLRYRPPLDWNAFDIIQALIPTYRPLSPDHDDFDIRLVDPRLWAVLAQIYQDLPPAFRTYTSPLSDVHLPLLQRVPSSSHFSLITLLSLSRCRHLTDDTVVELRGLHTLAALDASVTALGSWGLYRLAKTLSWSDGEDDPDEAPQRRGPWGLRVLYLNNCLNIDNKVLSYLSRFPLLSVVDLRGTTCKPWLEHNLLFEPSSDTRFYDPANLTGVLAHLSSLTETPSTLFSTRTPYVLHVDSLNHKTNPTPHAWPASNPWDPYSQEEDRELGRQVAKGRMDVFLPPKPERYYKPCPYQEYEMAANGNPDELYSEEDGDYDVETYREDSDPFGGSASESEGEDEEEEGEEEEDEEEDEDEEEEDEQPSGPWDMSDPQWGEGLRPRRVRQEPQPEVPRSWMNAAEDEMRIHRDRVSADRFYVVPAPGPRRTSSTPSLAASRNAQASTSTTSTSHPKPPDRLMLFRPPPPWSSLPSQPQPRPQTTKGRMPTSVFASSSTGHRPSPGPSNPPKRRQPEDVAPVQARKRMRTITSMQNIFSMVQKRSESATPASAGKGKGTDPAAAASSSGPAGRANPFARKQETAKVPLSTMLKRLDPSARTPTRPLERARPSSERKPQQYPELGPPAKPQAAVSPPVDEEKANRKGASKRPAPPVSAPTAAAAARTTDSASPRPAKKLKPITTLPVPDWPGKQMKPLSEHKHKLQPPLPKAQKQTTLPATVAARAKPQRRVSAPTRLELTPAKPEKSSAGKPKSRGTEKQARKSCGGGKGFDWKGWSAS